MGRLLITGASGRLGSQLRMATKDLAQAIRLTDVKALTDLANDEEFIQADLADMSTVLELMTGVDVVIHLGAVMPQAPWESILQANIIGTYNIFEAARQAGVKRVIFASSHHATGMYERTERLDSESPVRPANLYGLSKAFGETTGRMYHEKHGLEVISLRIGSCFPEPTDERMLATWLSHRDMSNLCRCCLQASQVGYTVLYGVSNNKRVWWSNAKAGYIGYQAIDSADDFEEALLTPQITNHQGEKYKFQSGKFANLVP